MQNSFSWSSARSLPPQAQSQSQKQQLQSGCSTNRNSNTNHITVLSSSPTNTYLNTNPSSDSTYHYYYEYGYGGYDGYDDEPPPKRVKMMIGRCSSLEDTPTSLETMSSTNSERCVNSFAGAGSVQSVEMASVEDTENANRDTVNPLLDTPAPMGTKTIDAMDVAFSRLVPIIPSRAFCAPLTDHLPLNTDLDNTPSSSRSSTFPDHSDPFPISGSFHFFDIHPSDSTTFTATEEDEDPAQYEKLYRTLCGSSFQSSYPADSVFSSIASSRRSASARCFIPTRTSSSQTLGLATASEFRPGLMQSTQIRDPINNEVLDIALTNLRHEPESRTQAQPPATASSNRSDTTHSNANANANSNPNPIAVVSDARIIGEGPIGDIVDAFGEFVLKRVWKKRVGTPVSSESPTQTRAFETETDLELFQGRLSLKIFYGEVYAERGIEDIGDYELAFWAVRSCSVAGKRGGAGAGVLKDHDQGLCEKDIEGAVEMARKRGAVIPW
ncbi:hypothetical protein K435DRAFT_852743 [Dendrothele bispora CBS 962.96]|uniref:Uncharacterized protein n=1 Tax=Dendrothele bispora (strain CBS 962.96) TaxID=1314807 RepID=A0A4S8MIE1_DENBC|nr:hypothetical protein K435DRAFT_852743 [Dendrothele bispora CBS 962.96]